MIVSIHQPDYIPYWGYFYKISKCDKFVFLDDCQFSNNNMHHWNRIKTPQGECRLKIPIEQHLGDPINKVRTKDELKWKQKHLRALEINYSQAPYYREIFPVFQSLLEKDYSNLADMNITINTFISTSFGFCPEFYRSSDLNIDSVNEKRVIDICVLLGGDEYISGNGARIYQVEDHFTAREVKLTYTKYHPFGYKQLWGNYIPKLSIIDYIFNYGFMVPEGI